MTNRTMLALDNADSRVRWLEDGLATYATGGRYRVRKLRLVGIAISHQ